jgi:tetratricopeptide (TPR) repeat protein
MFYQRKIQRIVPLLADGRPEEYIAQMDALLQTARGRNLHNVLLINLSAGYFTAKQYETAIEILEPLEKERLVGYSVKLCHRINLCTNYFYAGRCEQALAYYQSNQKLFAQYQNHKLYGGHIAEIDILAAIQCGQYEQAKTLLAEAKRTWTDPLLQEAFAAIEKTLDEING